MRLLLDLTRTLVALATRSVDATDGKVSLQQFRALYVLQDAGPCTAGGLAQALGSHPSTVTRLCDRLVETGYLTREVRPENRRQVELAVTPGGRRIVQAVLRRRATGLARLVTALSPRERDHLLAALPALLAAAEDQYGALPDWSH